MNVETALEKSAARYRQAQTASTVDAVYADLCDRIRSAHRVDGFSYRHIAKLVGISKSQIERICR